MAAALLVFYQGFTQDFYQGEVWQLLTNTGPVARLVLLMLLGFSILSWAIIIRKFRTFRAAQHESLEFLKVFRQSKKLSEIRAFCRTLKESPLPEVFQSGYREIESQAAMTEGPGQAADPQPGSGAARPADRRLHRTGPAGTMAGMAGHHRRGHSLCGVVRHRVGHH